MITIEYALKFEYYLYRYTGLKGDENFKMARQFESS